MNNLKVLLITSHFPPESSGGIGRPLSLYKHLPAFGIDIMVVTTNSFGQEKNERNIIRCESFKNWRQSSFLSKKRMLRYATYPIYKIFSVFTDSFWIKSVRKYMQSHLVNNKYDFIYATFPSADALKLGVFLHKKYNIPLISEFRDGLVFEPIIQGLNYLKKKQMIRFEKIVVNNSKMIITIGENISSYFLKTYGKQVSTIYNGYEEDDFSGLEGIRVTLSKKRRLAYFGSLNSTKVADRSNLFKAICNLKKDNKLNADNFEFCLIGNISNQEMKITTDLCISDIVTYRPAVPKKIGFKYIVENFDCLLFYGVEGETTIISSKLIEYLMLGKPVIGICKGNEAANIIKNTQVGEVCDFDVISIQNILLKMMENKVEYTPDLVAIKRFSRKSQANEIATLIQSCVS